MVNFKRALYVSTRKVKSGTSRAQCSTVVVLPLPATASHTTFTRSRTERTTAACSGLGGGNGCGARSTSPMVSNNADSSLVHSSEKRRRALELPRSAAATRTRHAAGDRMSPAAAKPPRLSRPAIARGQTDVLVVIVE